MQQFAAYRILLRWLLCCHGVSSAASLLCCTFLYILFYKLLSFLDENIGGFPFGQLLLAIKVQETCMQPAMGSWPVCSRRRVLGLYAAGGGR